MLVDQYGNELKSRYTNNSNKSPVAIRTRLTTDRDHVVPFSSFQTYKTVGDDVDWKLSFLREEQLIQKDANDLIRILLQSSPDLSRAHSDMQMFINTGFELTVLRNGRQSDSELDAAQQILDDALVQMDNERESLNTKIDKLVSAAFLKGALYTECVFDGPNGETFINIRVLNPFRVAYQEAEDEVRGQYILWGEERNGQFLPIESPLVQYIPMNPTDDSPLGNSMIASAIFPIVFMMGVLKSARQVIESQAWPSQLWKVDGEKMIASKSSSESTIAEDIDNVANMIEARVKGASLNEAFVFGAEVSEEIVGAMGKTNLDAIETIQKVLDQWIYRALKQFPVIFGSTEGNSLSTNAEEQLEAHSLFIDSIQTKIEKLLTVHFTQILRNARNMAIPVFRLRRTNALTDRIRTERFVLKAGGGIIDQVNAGILSPQEGKDMIRDSEAIDNIGTVLEADIQPEAQRSMGVSNAENERVQAEDEETETEES